MRHDTGQPAREAGASSSAVTDELLLDAQTFKDLEIFESEAQGTTLFEFCKLTRTTGGEKALRERMRRPWSNPRRIRAVQEAIGFMVEHRPSFDRLPSYVTTDAVRDYQRSVLPLIMSHNVVEFGFGVLEMRFGDNTRYRRIVRGVEASIALIRALRRLIERPELNAPPGELAPYFAELRELLARPAVAAIPERETWDMNAWTILRIDQVFRIHETVTMERLLRLVYEIDALLALANVTRKYGYVIPRIDEGPLAVRGEDVVHPLLGNPVPNPVALDQERRMLFLTGPNMAGKTTYLRACAVALYFAHLGMGVPARSFRFVPAQCLFSTISLVDDLRAGISFFRAEALRMKAIAAAVASGRRVVAFLDEPFKGTNVKDALDASQAIMERFARHHDCLFMFSSHLIELGERMDAGEQLDRRHFQAAEGAGPLRFDYLLRPGVSTQRLGMRVLEEEGIFALLDGGAEPPV